MDLDDQLRSIFRMLWELFTAERAAGLRIEKQRADRLTRPFIRLEQLSHRTVDRGSGMWIDEVLYAITIYGKERSQTEKMVSKIQQYLENGGSDYSNLYLIQGWRFGWTFPHPYVELRADGTVPTGDHQVRVSGIDICGNESAASVQQEITLVDGTQSFEVRIPRVTWMAPLFPRYRIYVDGHLEKEIPMPRWGYPRYTFTEPLLGTGQEPLEPVTPAGDLNAVRWRWLRVTAFSHTIREDLVEAGLFQATITLETAVNQPRGIPQTDTMQEIHDTIYFIEHVEVHPV